MDHDWVIKGCYIDLLHGDCIERISRMDDECVDSIVSDPPYELNLMGKKWDSQGIAHSVELWSECLRVLKPGGHLIAFSSTRTYHRMVCAIEDAGFEIRDQLAWMFGQGFPKSRDISKSIDDMLGIKRKVVGFKTANFVSGKSFGLLPWKERPENLLEVTKPVSKLAIKWEGWGTALKPGYEPICMARKPISEKNITLNVLKWGTGAINIEATRIRSTNTPAGNTSRRDNTPSKNLWGKKLPAREKEGRASEKLIMPEGRWPANVTHDGSKEIEEMFPSLGVMKPATISYKKYVGEKRKFEGLSITPMGFHSGTIESAARMFYSPKASIHDRNNSKHPTVKPIRLMRWLTRLVTPPHGIVLDPFAGSGTTGVASLIEGFDCVLVEREDEYVEIIVKRFHDYIKKYGKRHLF